MERSLNESLCVAVALSTKVVIQILVRSVVVVA